MKFGLGEGIWVILLSLVLILFFFDVINKNNSKSSK